MNLISRDEKANTQMITAFISLVVLIPTIIVTIFAVGPVLKVNDMLQENIGLEETNPLYYNGSVNQARAEHAWYIYLIFLVVISIIYFLVLAVKKEQYGGVTQRRL